MTTIFLCIGCEKEEEEEEEGMYEEECAMLLRVLTEGFRFH